MITHHYRSDQEQNGICFALEYTFKQAYSYAKTTKVPSRFRGPLHANRPELSDCMGLRHFCPPANPRDSSENSEKYGAHLVPVPSC